MFDNNTAVLFICSPSLGILDSWLPVLYQLKKQTNSEFIILFPKSRTVREIDKTNVLITIAEEIFDIIVYKDSQGYWEVSNTLAHAKQVSDKPHIRILNTFKKKCKLISDVYDITKIKAVCYDLYEESKDYCYSVLSLLHGVQRFSLGHGHGIDAGYKKNEKWVDTSTTISRDDVNVFLFSNRQRDFYKQYNIASDRFFTVGFPRHDSEWIKTLAQNTMNTLPEMFKSDYILVLSRPPSTTYFTPERKRAAVEDLKRIAAKIDKKLIIKLHPKEWKNGKPKDRIYEEVLGVNQYGVTWIYSNLHVLVLGKSAFFAVFFFSSTATDMVRLSVPVIARSDLKGIPEYDNENSYRDSNGSPTKGYRALGLCLGADDYSTMEQHVQRIVEDRDGVNRQLSRVYESLFPQSGNVSNFIAHKIQSYLIT